MFLLFFLLSSLSSSILSCPLGYYLKTSTCVKCDPSCETCSGSLFSNCLTCRTGHFLHENASVCEACPFGCAVCVSATECLACEFGFFLSGQTCLECEDNCRTCNGPNDINCLTCQSGYSLQSGSGTCIANTVRCPTIDGCSLCPTSSVCEKCRTGFYPAIDQTSCQICDKSCGNCFGPGVNQCTDCNPGGKLSSNNACIYNCSANCDTCFGILDSQCLTCPQGEVLEINSCINPGCVEECYQCGFQSATNISYFCQECIVGYFLSSGNCIECPENCSLCSSTTVCSKCEIGFYLLNGACPDCGLGCASCSSGRQCDVCYDGFYVNGSQCSLCNGNCRTCKGGNSTDCLSCHSDALLMGNTCIQASAPEDGLTVIGMKLIIALSISFCGISCLITVIYRACRKDPFFQLVEQEVREEQYRRRSLLNGGINPSRISNPDLNSESNDSSNNMNNQQNYTGLTVVIENKVSHFKAKRKEGDEENKEEEEKKEDINQTPDVNTNDKIQLATINESIADEEKSSILVT